MPVSIAPPVLLAALLASAAAHAASPERPVSDARLIASAMRAAPAGVARHATIMAMQPDGSMRTLRKGTNGFTCIPDAPATPGPDPMCADKAAMGWVHAWLTHATPPPGKVGLMYMLQGGTTPATPILTRPGRQATTGSRPGRT